MKKITYELKLEKSVKLILAVFAIGVVLNSFSSPMMNELFGVKESFAEMLGGAVTLYHSGMIECIGC
jgi:hypothetical protein